MGEMDFFILAQRGGSFIDISAFRRFLEHHMTAFIGLQFN